MAPFYQKYKPNFRLHADDVLGIQALYGDKADESPAWGSSTSAPSTTSTTPTSTPDGSEPEVRRRPRPRTDDDAGRDDDRDSGSGFFGSGGGAKPADLCHDSAIDAITRTEDGNTYVFRGQHYWLINNEGLAAGYPAKIARDWDGLPGNLDAALTWSDGKTFFFKGDKYWRFYNKRREPGYPKLISAGFAGIPNNVDAAFVWSGNGKTYFFKKDKYWRFDSKQEPPVSSQYPKSIKNWAGLPSSGIDAAFKWENGMTYFFKADLYYRFDDREFEVDTTARPAFPRSIAEWWFGCTNSNLPIRKKSPQDDADDSDPAGPASGDVAAAPSAGSSVLMFHRKPNLLYDNQPGGSQTALAKPRVAGNSISRSFLNSLSALFPSSSSSSSESSSSSAPASGAGSGPSSGLLAGADDWSFHRGLGEEVHKLLNTARSGARRPNAADADTDKPSHRAAVLDSLNKHRTALVPDLTRWTFPLSSSSGREQSLSELRVEPDSGDALSRRR